MKFYTDYEPDAMDDERPHTEPGARHALPDQSRDARPAPDADTPAADKSARPHARTLRKHRAAAPAKTPHVGARSVRAVRRPAKKHSALPRALRRVVSLLLVAALALAAWTYRAQLAPDRVKAWVQENLLGYSDGDGYPVSFGGSEVEWGNVAVADGTPAFVSSTGFVRLTKGGKTAAAAQHGYTNPVLRRCGSCFFIYDLGGKSFRVSTNGTDFTETAQYDYAIYCGAVARSGIYAVASAATGYTSQVTVFSARGNKLFNWSSQNALITAVCFSPDGKRVAAAAFSSEGGAMKTTVRVFAVSGGEALDTRELNDCMMLDMAFANENRLMLVGDTCAAGFTVGSGALSTYDYAGQSLSTYDLDVQGGAVLALSAAADGRSGTLVHFAPDFSTNTVARFSQSMRSVDWSAGGILTLSGGKVSLLDETGTVQGQADAGSDAVRALHAESGSCYILGASEIRKCALQ